MSEDEITRRFESVAELIREMAVAAEERHARAEVRHDREMAEIREETRKVHTELRRAVRLGVQEVRAERRRRGEADEHLDTAITRLAAAQLVTEEKLQGLIDALRRGGNGKP
jgi:hypothetical protein